MSSVKNFLKKIKEYDEIADIGEIGRRVFANNGFDGILTILGIIMGSYFGKVSDSKFIITAGLGACIAMGVSGGWGSYITEKAERKKEIRDLEKHTLKKMKNTKIEKAHHAATIIITLIDGLSPFLASFIVLIPFFFISSGAIFYAYVSSIILAFLLLVLLGAFLGKVSQENMVKYSLKMVLAGIVCIVLTMLIGFI
jgi:predicted membrane protein (TIGR00267 family)